MRLLLPLLLLAALVSCTSDPQPSCGKESCTAGQVCDPAAGRCRQALPVLCQAGTAWSPEGEQPAFQEVTGEWGLADLGVEGVRLSVADVDGDGFADLSVRRAGTLADDFSEGGARATWLLHNEAGTHFTDFTQASGLVTPRTSEDPAVGRPAEVVIWADVDDDGDVDAFTGSSNGDPAHPQVETSEIMLNDGTGHFTLGPDAPDLRQEGDFLVIGGATFLDVNRDGFVDLFIGHGAVSGSAPDQDRLLRGIGDGSFVDVTRSAGLITKPWVLLDDLNNARAHSNAWAAASCDLNDDGLPEILVSSYGRAPNHLWQGVPGPAVMYANRSIESGYAFDDRQDWTDNQSARCWCQMNPTDEGCDEVDEPPVGIPCPPAPGDGLRWDHLYDREPFRLGGNSATTVCADVNNDGALDLLTTEIVHWDVGSSSDPSELLINDGASDVHFDRPGNDATGLTRVHENPLGWNDGDMTAAVFDFDNDARPDIYIGSSDYPGTRGHLYWQRADGTFQEVPINLGIDHERSHGIGVADFDRDGDLDVAVGRSMFRCNAQNPCSFTATTRLFENVIGQAGNWIQLDLVGGAGTNRSAIGARVTVEAGGVTQTQEVGGGYGHYGIQRDHVLHFGLGSACEATVTIRWPDQTLSVQHFTAQAGYRYQVQQGRLPVPEAPPAAAPTDEK